MSYHPPARLARSAEFVLLDCIDRLLFWPLWLRGEERRWATDDVATAEDRVFRELEALGLLVGPGARRAFDTALRNWVRTGAVRREGEALILPILSGDGAKEQPAAREAASGSRPDVTAPVTPGVTAPRLTEAEVFALIARHARGKIGTHPRALRGRFVDRLAEEEVTREQFVVITPTARPSRANASIARGTSRRAGANLERIVTRPVDGRRAGGARGPGSRSYGRGCRGCARPPSAWRGRPRGATRSRGGSRAHVRWRFIAEAPSAGPSTWRETRRSPACGAWACTCCGSWPSGASRLHLR
jgi:hypothetical protein